MDLQEREETCAGVRAKMLEMWQFSRRGWGRIEPREHKYANISEISAVLHRVTSLTVITTVLTSTTSLARSVGRSLCYLITYIMPLDDMAQILSESPFYRRQYLEPVRDGDAILTQLARPQRLPPGKVEGYLAS